MRKIIVNTYSILITFIISIIFLYFATPFLISFFIKSENKKVEWENIYDLQNLNTEYVAQGIETYKNYILFTIHKKDKKSTLIIFKKNKKKLIPILEFDLPKEATHTSDLCINKELLYTIDYTSNYIYKIDIDKSIEKKELVLLEKYYTNMKKTGSLTIINYKNEDYLLISQFIISNKLSFIKLNDLNNDGYLDKKIAFHVKSDFFIQGLYAKNNYIYIATNKYGVDIIYKVDIQQMIEKKSSEKAIVKAIVAPGKMVEGITIYKNKLMTSDESVNIIYQTEVF